MRLRNVSRTRCPVVPRVEELEGRRLPSVALLPGPGSARTAALLRDADSATAGAGGLIVTVRDASTGSVAPPRIPFEREPLTVRTRTGDVSFSVEIARTPAQRRYGLMHRQTLARDEGMLFLLPRDQRVVMWMKGTPLPLDMLFIDRHGRIVSIARKARPFTTKLIRARQPVRAVLEILGGTAALRGIGVGDQVIPPGP